LGWIFYLKIRGQEASERWSSFVLPDIGVLLQKGPRKSTFISSDQEGFIGLE
jgi:hypothetical protein